MVYNAQVEVRRWTQRFWKKNCTTFRVRYGFLPGAPKLIQYEAKDPTPHAAWCGARYIHPPRHQACRCAMHLAACCGSCAARASSPRAPPRGGSCATRAWPALLKHLRGVRPVTTSGPPPSFLALPHRRSPGGGRKLGLCWRNTGVFWRQSACGSTMQAVVAHAALEARARREESIVSL